MSTTAPQRKTKYSALGCMILVLTVFGALAGTAMVVLALNVEPKEPPVLTLSLDQAGLTALAEVAGSTAAPPAAATAEATEDGSVPATAPAPSPQTRRWIGRDSTWIRTESGDATRVLFAFDVAPACNAADALELPAGGVVLLPVGAVTRGDHDLYLTQVTGRRSCSEPQIIPIRVDNGVDPVADLRIGRQSLYPVPPEPVWIGQAPTMTYRAGDYDSPIGVCIVRSTTEACPTEVLRDANEVTIPVALNSGTDSESVFVRLVDATGNESELLAMTLRVDNTPDALSAPVTATPSVDSQQWQSSVERVRLNWGAPAASSSPIRGLVYIEKVLEDGESLDALDPCATVDSEPSLLSAEATELVLPSDALREGGRSGRFAFAVAALDVAGNCGSVSRYGFWFDDEADETQVQYRVVGDPILQVLGADGSVRYSDDQRLDMRFAARSPSGRAGADVRFLIDSREIRDCEDIGELDRVENADERGQAHIEWDPPSMGDRIFVRALDAAGNCGPEREINFESSR